MGKKTKQGKGRLDKYYHIAKQQGYRSRASFKLIQINKKYNFLQKSHVVIDLCAAPGGWLQVCEKFCPYGAIKIGIDLDKIPAITGCKTFQQDITTPECFQLLRNELKNQKADAVLNDGAPNVGSNWNKDAFQQIELTLSALKLACTFLKKGGNFITKVFRSTDYNALIYVMKKFFKKVEANKPLASRFASAEIFVCCIDFIAPDIIDDKLFDPKFIFQETETDMQHIQLTHEINSIDKIMEKRRKRQGYSDDAPMMLSRKMPFEEFLKLGNPYPTFVTHSIIEPPSEEMLNLVKPPQFYDEYLQDLQVLGKREIAGLIKWRGKLRQKIKSEEQKSRQEQEDAEEIEEEVEQLGETEIQVDGELQEWDDVDSEAGEEEEDDEDDSEEIESEQDEAIRKLQKKELNEQRKKKEKKNKLIANQGVSTDFGAIEDEELFNLSQHKKLKKMGYVEVEDEEVEKKQNKVRMTQKDIEENLEQIYESQMQKSSKSRIKNNEKLKQKNIEVDDDKFECEPLEQNDKQKKNKKGNFEEEDIKEQEEIVKQKLANNHWFDKDVFKGVGGIENEDETEFKNPLKAAYQGKQLLNDEQSSDEGELMEDEDEDEDEYEDVSDEEEEEASFDGENLDFDDGEDFHVDKKLMKKRKMDEDNYKNIKIDPNEALPGEKFGKDAYKLDVPKSEMQLRREKLKAQRTRNEKKERNKIDEMNELNQPMEIVPETKIEDFTLESLGETLAVAKKMLRKRAREQIIDHSYNRYAFEDHDELPTWFVEDERRHEFKIQPVTKEEVQAEMDRIKAINSKAPKKVLEAKIRKKKRLEKKMKRTNKQVAEIFEQEGITEKMKIGQARALYQKSINQVNAPQKKKLVLGKKSKTGPVNQKSKSEIYSDRRSRKDEKNNRAKKKKGIRGQTQSGNGGAKPSRTCQVKRRKRKTLRC